MKLNVGCGRETKKGFVNIDIMERENKLDMILDVTKDFPFEKDSIEYIYAEQFIEHLEWNDGFKFLQNCYNCLKMGGILRLVLPDYYKIFKAYLLQDKVFFKVFYDELNNGDLPYYSMVYDNPERIKEERRDNPPPKWHTSAKLEDRERLALRLRHYKYDIELVNWFTHQYHEHVCLYDFESLNGILRSIGFENVLQTEIKDIDSHAPSRITSSLFMEAFK